jgi:hypothetical protein
MSDFYIGTEDNKSTMEYMGISLTPYVQAAFGPIGVRANFFINRIGANPDYSKVYIEPQIGVSYSF